MRTADAPADVLRLARRLLVFASTDQMIGTLKKAGDDEGSFLLLRCRNVLVDLVERMKILLAWTGGSKVKL